MNSKEKKELVKQEKKNKKEHGLFYKITNVILWVIVLGWMTICVIDFVKVQQEKEPIFCLKKETTKYEDGNVDICVGAGYKVYNYNRESFKAIEFGPFWTKDRSNEENK